MNLRTELYKEQIIKWPKKGYHIMAQYTEQEIVVYQSYRPEIGCFAAKNGFFGGAFSLDRMTWIKPNFLWMMYRNGWGTKAGQEVTLAIRIKMDAFKRYLKAAEYSSFDMTPTDDFDKWKSRVSSTSCRLQWDPDHDPYGTKLERRAIQIGIRNEQTRRYAREDIISIEDISDFVAEQRLSLDKYGFDQLVTPSEQPLVFEDELLNKKLKISRN